MKAVVTVVGKDKVGIIAKVSGVLCENEINILDISQTIVDGFFNMMMIVDFQSNDKKFTDIAAQLEAMGVDINCVIRAQREEIFDKMHRL